MSRFFISILFLYSSLFAKVSWDSQKIYSLKKDEVATIYFYEKGKDKKNYTYPFSLRWTLYDGKKVVVLSKYRSFPVQHVLYFDYKLDSFRQTLSKDISHKDYSYVLVQMDKFHKSKKEISFMVFVKDSAKKYEVKYQDLKRKD